MRTPVPLPRARRSWLCPTDADVQRFYDAAGSVNLARRILVIVLALCALVTTPWTGVTALLTLLLAGAMSVVAGRPAAFRLRRMVSGVVIIAAFQLVLSLGVAVTGGLASPFLGWLAIPVAMLAARYRRTVVLVATAVALGFAGLACLAAAPVHYPLLLNGVGMVGLTISLAAIVLNLQSAEIESRRAAESDPLTGLLNRKALGTHFARILEEGAGRNDWVTVIMADLDHFKAINDQYGHATGDDVLRQAAVVLGNSVGREDRVFRVGGEEFLILAPWTGWAAGLATGERIRAALAAEQRFPVPVTVSVGVTSGLCVAATGYQSLIQAADEALYAAKTGGRNRVCAAGPGAPGADAPALSGGGLREG